MGEVRHGRTLTAHAVAVLSQLEHAFIRGDQLGVGNGVGGAGEQVKEADRLPHLSGQYPQGQVKRPRYITENRPEQFVRGGHLGLVLKKLAPIGQAPVHL